MDDDAAVTAEATSAVDLWVGLLSGRNTWADSDERPSTLDRAAGSVKALALTATLTAVVAGSDLGRGLSDSDRAWLAVALTGVTIALSAGPVRLARGGPVRPRSMWVNLPLRIGLSLLFVTFVYALAPRWGSLASWPVGVALGIDAASTAQAIGWSPSPLGSARSFVLSPVHAGIVGGLVGAAVASGGQSMLEIALPIYVTTVVWILVAIATAWLFGLLRADEADQLQAARLDTVRDEHRRSAHWLHDDIASRLRVVNLRLQREEPSIPEISMLLDDLDFQLRLRQLDELLSSGEIRLAEILQPYVRQAQSHGVMVDHVPTFDTAAEQVDEQTGRLFRRAAAILTSNALNAGARHISYEVRIDDDAIAVAVTDDAGGFELTDISQGRGLWVLRADLGPDSVQVRRSGAGSTVEVVIPRRRSEARR